MTSCHGVAQSIMPAHINSLVLPVFSLSLLLQDVTQSFFTAAAKWSIVPALCDRKANREHWEMMPDRGKLKYSAENLSQFHFVHYKP
jgi:hypothetical protein